MSTDYSFGLPLKQHFVEYVYYQHFFAPGEINKIRGLWQEQETEIAHMSGDERYKFDLRKSSVMFIDNTQENRWIFDKLAMIAVQANNERYWFDLLGFHEGLQLTKYTTGDYFDWHLDFGPGEVSHRKLSLTMQLSDSDEYEGGDLQFLINGKEVIAPREKGTIIVFPSFIMHRVTPITKGTRQSIVGWVTGPPYR